MSAPLRILLCSHNPLKRELGAPKVLIELAEQLPQLGWNVDLLSLTDFGMSSTSDAEDRKQFAEKLRDHLRLHGDNYDVIDYEHEYLPYPRTDFSSRPLMVARSVLLVHHLQTLPLPHPAGLRSLAGRIVRGQRRAALLNERVARATTTFKNADLVNVSNDYDKIELTRRGIDTSKIAVIPFGLSRSRVEALGAVPLDVPTMPVVAFVGTFDYRKGARDLPRILRSLTRSRPRTRFKMIGTQGLFRTAEQVAEAFPRDLRDRLEIHPVFSAEKLPQLLVNCSVGIFPSHIEGFGFGVLEMLAAGLPVIAYDVPGPPMMLPAKWLVRRGDTQAAADKLAELLGDENALLFARQTARALSTRFTWEAAAALTDATYRAALADRKTAFT